MSVYRRGDSWYVNVTLNGRRINRKAGDSRREAVVIQEELRRKARLHRFRVDDFDDIDYYFAQLAEEWLINLRKRFSRGHYDRQENYFNNHVKPVFQDYEISQLTTKKLSDFQADKKESGLSNRTVNILVGIIRKILNHGQVNHPGLKRTLAEINLSFPKGLRESKRKYAYFTEQEFQLLQLKIKNPLTRARVLVTRHTGMRPIESAYLEWPDVHFEQRFIRIQSKRVNGTHWQAKDAEERDIPLNPEALAALQELYRHRKGRWVFSKTDQPVIDMDKALSTAATAAGIERKVGPNMLRHTFAVLALQNGANIEALRKILGHADIRTTMKYMDCIDSEKVRAVNLSASKPCRGNVARKVKRPPKIAKKERGGIYKKQAVM